MGRWCEPSQGCNQLIAVSGSHRVAALGTCEDFCLWGQLACVALVQMTR